MKKIFILLTALLIPVFTFSNYNVRFGMQYDGFKTPKGFIPPDNHLKGYDASAVSGIVQFDYSLIHGDKLVVFTLSTGVETSIGGGKFREPFSALHYNEDNKRNYLVGYLGVYATPGFGIKVNEDILVRIGSKFALGGSFFKFSQVNTNNLGILESKSYTNFTMPISGVIGIDIKKWTINLELGAKYLFKHETYKTVYQPSIMLGTPESTKTLHNERNPLEYIFDFGNTEENIDGKFQFVTVITIGYSF